MDPGVRRAVRVTRLTLGLFGSGILLLCCRADGDEGTYRREIYRLVEWCPSNNLSPNVNKTKELIVDFRKAHYKDPELTVEGEQNEGEPMRLTCSSCGGYPEPTVHWTSGFLDIDENSTAKVYTNCSPEHLCNITSTLRIQSPVNNVTCKIYNAKLKENKTATYFREEPLDTDKNAIVSESVTHHRWTIPMVIVVVILVLLAVYIVRRYFSKSPSADDVPAQKGELASFVSLDPAV
ncbi:uncharacterized protein [Mobula birostris]|uniref:uncharacterized protein isoform X5 n=1 Tax=Mobula birostris TaxID=1983395 RepID=UPI003B27D324